MDPLNIISVDPRILFRILSTIIGGAVIIIIARYSTSFFFRSLKTKSALSSYKKRLNTLRTLLENIVSLGLLAIILLMIIKDLGFDITPILTGAGILGLAVSFGSQSLVKDLISGFFIILENQYNVGDCVEIAGKKGFVNKINLRTTVIEDSYGNKSFIPNSKIDKVTVIKEKK